MLIHFDLKQLNEILKDFYEVTSLRYWTKMQI